MIAKSAKSPRQAVLVLGMHRSGTSALAGTLSILGCDLPASQMKADEHNSKGYFESSKLYLLHDQLLASAGSSWDDWLSVNPGWFESARAEEYRERAAATLREEFGQSRLFVLKDPRICRLLPFWFDVLADEDCTPSIIHTHRHPLEVARSIERRDGIGIDLGMLLWLRHILDAERDSRGAPRVFTSYHRLMNDWAETAQGFQDTLGIKLPRMARTVAGEVEAFLARDLKHFTESPDKVLRSPMISEWIREVYRILESWAESGENEDDRETLDQVRAEFDAAAPAFHRLVELGQQTSRSLKETTSELAELSEEKSGLQAQAEERGKTIEDLERQLSELQAGNERRKQELEGKLADSEEGREQLRQKLSEVEEKIEKRNSRIAHLEEESETQTALVDQLARKLDDAETERAADRDLAQRFETELDEARAELAALKDELSHTKSHLEQRTHEAEETAKDLARVQNENTEKARKIETLRAEIWRQEHDLATQEETARQQATDLANVSTLLAERESSLEASRNEINELNSSAKALTDQLNEERLTHAAASARSAEQLRELEHSVEIQVRELTQVSQILLDTETKFEREQAKSAKLQAELEGKLKKAEDRVKALETSTSWRITAPLRKIRRAFKRRG